MVALGEAYPTVGFTRASTFEAMGHHDPERAIVNARRGAGRSQAGKPRTASFVARAPRHG